jgi:hypothetical protein
MKIETCTSYPDDQLEKYRPDKDVEWKVIISGGWSQDCYHSGHIAYYMAKVGENAWVMDSVARNAELDGVTEEDVEQGRLNDDQIQALWGTTLEAAQAQAYKRIVAVWHDAPRGTDDRVVARTLYAAVKDAGGLIVDDPDDEWDDSFGLAEGPLGRPVPEANDASRISPDDRIVCCFKGCGKQDILE